jgi:hypothetical protein
MSRSFRSVIETWGVSSSCFLPTDKVAVVLEEIACQAGTCTEVLEYGADFLVVWVADGKAFLDAAEAGAFSLSEFELARLGTDPEDVNDEDLDALVGNVKALAKKWRKSLDPADGTLRFYIDV